MTSKAFGLAQLGNVYNDGALSSRNLIINGAMQVAQRGDLTGVTSTTNYFVDRFQYVGSDEGTWSLSQASDAPAGSGFTKSAKLEITTADASIASGDYANFRYKVENQDIKHILKGTADAKELTISFWVKSSLAQDFQLRLRDNHSSTARQVIRSFTIAASNTWQKEVITFAGDTGGDDFSGAADTGSNFILEWMLGAGTDYQGGTASGNWENFDNTKYDTTDTFLTTVNSTFYITGVQLEVGDTATPFEHRSYGDELARCQRYFTKVGDGQAYTRFGSGLNWATGGLGSNALINLPTPLRAVPTLTTVGTFGVYNGNAAVSTATSISIETVGSSTSLVSVNVSTSGLTRGDFGTLIANNSTAAALQFDAEL